MSLVGMLLTVPSSADAAAAQTFVAHSATSGTASITGTVTGSPTVPLASVKVTAYTAGGRQAGTATTNSSGTYLITGLAADSYTMSFSNSNPSFIPSTWWNNRPSQLAAVYFDITSGQAAKGRNIVLPGQATISGTVVGQGSPNVPLKGVTVTAWDEVRLAPVSTSVTDASGRYTLAAARGTAYRLQFANLQNTAFVKTSWWKNEVDHDRGDRVDTQQGQSVDVGELVLPPGASVSGTVKRAGSPPVPVSATVEVYHALDLVDSVQTDTAGRYSITGLAAEDYILRFVNHSGGGVTRTVWWDNKPTLMSATGIEVATGQKITGQDLVLQKGSSISGVVTGAGSPAKPLAGVKVSAYSGKDGLSANTAVTDAEGKYTITGLITGYYKLQVVPPDDSGFVRESWWSGAQKRDEANQISVGVAATVSDKNMVLPRAGRISGTIKNTASAGIAGVTVTAWTTPGGARVLQVITDANGRYTLPGLPPGSYSVGFTDSPVNSSWYYDKTGSGGLKYQDEFFSNQPNLDKATPITLAGGQTFSANATLADKLYPLATTSVPTIGGTAKVGQKLTAAPGSWSPSPVTFTYQWKSGGVSIAGATASTYTVRSADLDHTLTVSVTGTKTGYVPVTTTSTATAKVVG